MEEHAAILGSYKYHGAVAVELCRLIPSAYFAEKALFSRRTVAELLSHMLSSPWIDLPDQESVEEVMISNPSDFLCALDRSVAFLDAALGGIDLRKEYPSPGERRITGLECAVNVVAHLVAHRSQLYLFLASKGVVIPKETLDSFFPSHIPLTKEEYASIRKSNRGDANPE